MCDLAYVVLLDNLDRHVLADRHVAAVLMAAGQEVALPLLGEQRALFDASLVAEPQPAAVESDEMELRRVLGVA